ncbi:LamG-like jellyroll fold domain-containing protein [Streptomyces sp. LS1784]|uniref:LamG-like jellyroll fold domain-containing protein n=1 Tax=Streptomyces sp. LS1784 TaxID=2851533 RepID=UPI001CCF36F6|nr:LamG-like jellyroll fold domain-containing protein [Streptomyces sp. LS1784]
MLTVGVTSPVAFADQNAGGIPSTDVMDAADASHRKDRPQLPDDAVFAQAKATGKDVPIERLATEFTETLATPDGHLRQVRHPDQQRLKIDGTWQALDATLTAHAGGTYSPRAVPSGVALSAGGNGPLATMTSSDGKKLSLSAPFDLPAPRVEGNSLLYPGVIGPDTDLRVSVGKNGSVRTVLVVKTAQAAANPALKNLHFGTKTDGVSITSDADHNVTAADSDGVPRWTAPAPRMWDSTLAAPVNTPPTPTPAPTTAARTMAQAAQPTPTTGTPAPAPTAGTDAPGKAADPASSSPDGPGAGAKVSTMPVSVSNTGIDLTTDQAVLSTGTAPYFIDPDWIPWSRGSNGSTYVQSKYPNTPHYNLNGPNDTDHLGVGRCGVYPSAPSCNPSDLMRSYFQFDTSDLRGAIINSVRLDFWEYISADWDCNKTYGVDVYLVDRQINSGTVWNNKPMPVGGRLDSTQVAGSGRNPCHDNVDVPYWNLDGLKQYIPANNVLTVGLQAADENNVNAFKRFDYGASLTVTYDRTPNTPTDQYVYPVPKTMDPSQATQGCAGAPWGWLNSSALAQGAVTLNATVSSPVQNQLYSWSHIWDYNLPGAPDVAGGFSDLVTNGGNAAFVVPFNVIQDGHAYGYSIMAGDMLVGLSDSTPICRFAVDVTPPQLSFPTLYDQLSDDALADQFPPAGNGQTSKKRLGDWGVVPFNAVDPAPSGGTPSGVACARWGWDPQLAGSTWQCGAARPQGGVSVRPGSWGTNILFMQVMDNAGNQSPIQSYAFHVPWNPAGPPPVFGDITGDGAPDILTADQAGNLQAYSVPGNPLAKSPAVSVAALKSNSPVKDGDWKTDIQFTHRGALSGGKNVDDLIVHAKGDTKLWYYGNPGNTHYTGRFDTTQLLDKPACETPVSDSHYCDGYSTNWSTVLRLASVGDPIHSDLDYKLQFRNGAGLLTTEMAANGADAALWYYPTLGTSFGAPVRVSATGWKDMELLSPGDWANQGHPGLWSRNMTTGELRGYTFTTGVYAPTHDGEPILDPITGQPVSAPTLVSIDTNSYLGAVPPNDYPVLGSDGDLTGNGAPALWGRSANGQIQIWWGHRTGTPTTPGIGWEAGPVTVADTKVSPVWYALDNKPANIAVDSSVSNPLVTTGNPTAVADHNGVPNGAIALNGGYYRSSQSPNIDTRQSYSIATWVKINNTNGYQTVATLAGNQHSPFYLQYSKAFGRWAFVAPADDNINTSAYYAAWDSTSAPQVGVWTHLIGVYNASDKTMTLYVNGQAVGSTINPSTWATPGSLSIGGQITNSSPATPALDGAVSDVRLYPYALTDQQANNLATSNSSVHIHSLQRTATCLDNWGGSGELAINDCGNAANQHFTFNDDRTITNAGKCLGTKDNASTSGTPVVLRPCDATSGSAPKDGEGQQWIRGYDGTIRNVQSGLCIDIPHGITTNGTRMIVWTCAANNNQKWFARAQLNG